VDPLAKKFAAASKLALRKDAETHVECIEVSSSMEAEMILQMVLATTGPSAQLLRERIYAIVLLEPSGLNIKRAGSDWETLTQLSPPAVLLFPSGIRSYVGGTSKIKWGERPDNPVASGVLSVGCGAILLALLYYSGIGIAVRALVKGAWAMLFPK
jgi:hypothetical protein